MLKTRVLTAIVALPIVFAAILFLKPVYFAVIFAALLLCGAWEWSALIGFTRTAFRVMYLIGIAMGIFLAAFFPVLPVLFVAVALWLWTVAAIIHYQCDGSGAGFQFPPVRALIGFIVLISTWVSVVTLQTDTDMGPHWLILVLLITFAADVGGYFAGRALGSHALCSRVSPKKTWEGFAGGMIFSVFVAAIGGLLLSLSHQQYAYLLLLTLITALFSVVGDLSVSLLKRMSGIKDSGTFFPGHGGVLDRLDSVAAATVIFVFGALFLI